MERPLVTVYIPCHNYGHFLQEAIDSVFAQSLGDWELILIDDGATDHTADVCRRAHRRAPHKVRLIHHDKARGLQANANEVLELARGKYIMRLDADDWLDESALLVMSHCLEAQAEVALVYPNFVYVDEQGRQLGVENRKKIGDEARLLDLPVHGACTMVRRRVLKALGGYDEAHNAQDGYELWLKVSRRYEVQNIATPLFFYRQHSHSLSRDEDRLLRARGDIKRRMVQRLEGKVRPRVLGIVPAKNTYQNLPNVALAPLGGKPLIDHTLSAARASECFDALWVTTDCEEVMAHCEAKGVDAMLRPAALSKADRQLSEVVYDAVERLETGRDCHPDIVVVLSVHSPLRRAKDIVKAIDSLILYDADSVISVYEDYDLHFRHGADGLEPLNPAMMNRLRLEREGLYVFNGAITAVWRDGIQRRDYYGDRISHVVMPQRDSFQLKSAFDQWLLNALLEARQAHHQELTLKKSG